MPKVADIRIPGSQGGRQSPLPRAPRSEPGLEPVPSTMIATGQEKWGQGGVLVSGAVHGTLWVENILLTSGWSYRTMSTPNGYLQRKLGGFYPFGKQQFKLPIPTLSL